MTDNPNEIDHGPDPDVMTCPICASKMHRISVRQGTYTTEQTNKLRCPNLECVFGDTKELVWYQALQRKFNNRESIREICVAKDCEGVRVVRVGPFCPTCEKKYLGVR